MTPTRSVVFCPAVALCAVVSAALAQSYSVDWFSVDGGGGTSTGGFHSVSGSIGQPDVAAAMIGGRYSVTGGFWSFIAVVPTPGAPALTITVVGTNALISWPSLSAGFELQTSSDVADGSGWSNYGGPVTDDGNTRNVTVPLGSGNRFYRLSNH